MESSLASGFGAGNWVQAGPVGAGPGSAAAPAPSREAEALCHGAPSHGDQAPFLAETAASFIFFWWCMPPGPFQRRNSQWLGAGWEWPAAGTGGGPEGRNGRGRVAGAAGLRSAQPGQAAQPWLSRRGSQ